MSSHCGAVVGMPYGGHRKEMPWQPCRRGEVSHALANFAICCPHRRPRKRVALARFGRGDGFCRIVLDRSVIESRVPARANDVMV